MRAQISSSSLLLDAAVSDGLCCLVDVVDFALMMYVDNVFSCTISTGGTFLVLAGSLDGASIVGDR